MDDLGVALVQETSIVSSHHHHQQMKMQVFTVYVLSTAAYLYDDREHVLVGP